MDIMDVMNDTVASTPAFDPETLWSYKAFKVCGLIGFIFVFVGIVANSLCFMTADYLFSKSTATYLIKYLAIWDTISVIHDGWAKVAGVKVNLGLKYFDVWVANWDTYWCKWFNFHSWGSSFTANFHVVALSVDRMLAIYCPIWHRQHSGRATAIKASVFIAVTQYIIVAPNLLYFTTVDNICLMLPGQILPQLMSWYLKIALYGFYSGVPFVFLSCTNIVFILSLRNARNKKHDMKKNQNQGTKVVDEKEKKRAQQDKGLTIMLIVMSMSFIVLTGTCGAILVFLLEQEVNTVEDLYFVRFLEVLGEIPPVVNNSCNFFFYYASGPVFRAAFLKMLKAKFGGGAASATSGVMSG